MVSCCCAVNNSLSVIFYRQSLDTFYYGIIVLLIFLRFASCRPASAFMGNDGIRPNAFFADSLQLVSLIIILYESKFLFFSTLLRIKLSIDYS